MSPNNITNKEMNTVSFSFKIKKVESCIEILESFKISEKRGNFRK